MRPKPIKSLVVEDSLVCAMGMRAMLSPYGPVHTVSTAQDGIDSFKLAWDNDEPYDIIWMDIILPNDMDGIDAVRVIRRIEDDMDYDQTYIVFCSGLSDMRDLVRAFFQRDRTSFLIKPISPGMIRNEVCRTYCSRGDIDFEKVA